MKIETLKKAKEVAAIFALVAVPIIVAWGTQMIQNRISEEGMRKDYVALAIGILTKKKDEQPDIELRQWAVEIVDKNSPVHLPASLKTKLGMGGAAFDLTWSSGKFDDLRGIYGIKMVPNPAIEKMIEEARKREAAEQPKKQ
jgi:hypothetical protein